MLNKQNQQRPNEKSGSIVPHKSKVVRDRHTTTKTTTTEPKISKSYRDIEQNSKTDDRTHEDVVIDEGHHVGNLVQKQKKGNKRKEFEEDNRGIAKKILHNSKLSFFWKFS